MINKIITQIYLAAFLFFAIFLLGIKPLHAQQGIATNYLRLYPSALPSVCHQGDLRFDTVTNFLQSCTTANTWSPLAQGLFIYPLTTLGDVLYDSGTSPHGSRLAGNTSSTKKFLTQTGTGTVSAAPGWNLIVGSDLPNPSASTLGGVESYASVTHQWLDAISTSGVPHSSRPACSDLSDSVSSCSVDATNATNISSGTLGVARGGLGQGGTPSNGQLPMGDGVKYVPATITAGSGIIITNGPGSVTIASTGGLGSNATATNADLMIDKMQREHLGIYTDVQPNAVFDSFQQNEFAWEAKLLQDYTSGGSMSVVANPLFLDSSDLNTDSATNWSTVSAAGTLTTSATAKVGAASLKFNKTGSAVDALITIAPTNFNVNANANHWVWVNLPTTTGVASLRVVLAQESGLTNTAVFDLTTQYDGSGLVTGWNLIHTDVSTTPTSTTGSGWVSSQQVGGYAVGVVTSVAGTTLTGVLVDNPVFADSTNLYLQLGERYQIYSNSASDFAVVDSANTSSQGVITLANVPSNNYSAGNTSSGTHVVRTVPTIGGGYATRVTGLSYLGMVQSQPVQLKKIIPTSLSSSNLEAVVSFDTKKILRVASINGGLSQISLTDPGDNHAQFVTGNTIHVVQIAPTNGREVYLTRAINPSLTGNATASGGVTTLTLSSVASISVGDIVVKDQIGVYGGAMTAGANEPLNQISMSRLDVSNDGAPIPEPATVFGHYTLGGYSTIGANNLFGPGPNLTINGTLSALGSFFARQFSVSGFSSSNHFDLSTTQSTNIKGVSGPVSGSIWVKITSNTSSQFLDVWNSTSTGWYLGYDSSATKFFLNTCNGVSGCGAVYNNTIISTNTWYNVAFSYAGGNSGAVTVWVNGSGNSGTSGTIADSTNILRVGDLPGGSASYNFQLGDLLLWTSAITQSDVNAVASNGVFRTVGNHDSYKAHFSATNQTGNALYMMTIMGATTDADDLKLTGMGMTP